MDKNKTMKIALLAIVLFSLSTFVSAQCGTVGYFLDPEADCSLCATGCGDCGRDYIQNDKSVCCPINQEYFMPYAAVNFVGDYGYDVTDGPPTTPGCMDPNMVYTTGGYDFDVYFDAFSNPEGCMHFGDPDPQMYSICIELMSPECYYYYYPGAGGEHQIICCDYNTDDFAATDYDHATGVMSFDCVAPNEDFDDDGWAGSGGYTVDCDDDDPDRHPQATESCNNVDENCDGVRDDGVPRCDCADDGSPTAEECNGIDDDCNGAIDFNEHEFFGSVGPDPEDEICGNGVDDNCNGQADEGCSGGAGGAGDSVYYYFGSSCGFSGNNAGANDVCMIDDFSAIKIFQYDTNGNIWEEATFVKLRNLLGNPGFELGSGRTDFWRGVDGGVIYADAPAYSGGVGGRAIVYAISDSVESLPISLKPSTVYTFSAYIQADDLNHNLELDVDLYDSTGGSEIETDVSQITLRTYLDGETGWQRKYYTFRTSADTVKGSVVIRAVSDSAVPSTFYIDNLQLERIGTTTPFFDNTFITKYDYDSSDNLRGIYSPSGAGAIFNLRPDLQVDEVWLLSGQTVDLQYDGSDRVDYIDYGTSIDATYTYTSGKITRMDVDIQSGGGLIDEIYTFNGDNLELINAAGDPELDPRYDSLNRLIGYDNNDDYLIGHPEEVDFTYNNDGDIQFIDRDGTIDTYTYNGGNNRLSQTAGYTYTYDPNGNIISKGSDIYYYDYDNRLVKVENSAGTFVYVYDSDGNRIMKGSQQGTDIYIYDYNGNIIYNLFTNVIMQIPEFCDTYTFSQGAGFVIKHNGERVFRLDSGGVLQIRGNLFENVVQADMPATRNFDLKDLAGDSIFAVDQNGNLYLTGVLEDYARPVQLMPTAGQDLLIRDYTGDEVAVFRESGDLNIKACIAKNIPNIS